jgi:hypothetical protein
MIALKLPLEHRTASFHDFGSGNGPSLLAVPHLFHGGSGKAENRPALRTRDLVLDSAA